MPFGWPLVPPGGLAQLDRSLLQEDANRDRPEIAHLGSPHLRWRRDVLQPPEVSGSCLPETCAFTFQLEAFDAFLGIREGFLAPLLHRNVPGDRSIWARMTTSFVSKKHMGRMIFCKRVMYFFSIPFICYFHAQ